MKAWLVITVMASDRPGIVQRLASTVKAHDGNWLESRMARLAGKFAGILRVEVAQDQARFLSQALRELAIEGMQVLVEVIEASEEVQPQQSFLLEIMGNDRPGIVSEVSAALAAREVNVDEFNSECIQAPMTGMPLFTASVHIRIPPQVNIHDLRADLEHIASDLIVDITLTEEARNT